ncbi:MAG: fimbrial biogenesis chaperone [Croceibacterium sp.]
MNALARLCCVAALLVCASLPAYDAASAQGIEVAPVNVQLAPGQQATTLTVTNHKAEKIAFQVRGFAWQQDADGNDVLTPTDVLLSSPPIATVQAGGSQVVRLVLRQPPQGREATYRIVFDQLPPPSEPGVIHVLVRLSIPVFAEPQVKVTPAVHWRVANQGGRWWLIAVNGGTRHLSVSKLKLVAPDGKELEVDINSPPHILAGATRRWPIQATAAISPNEVLRLTGSADVGAIDERISIDAGP